MRVPKLFIDWPDRNLGAMAPWGYGVAWRNYNMRTITLIIIPFNFLCSWIRDRYFTLLKGPRGRLIFQLIEFLSEEEAKGYNDGYRDGYDKGERAGFDRAKLVVEEMMR